MTAQPGGRRLCAAIAGAALVLGAGAADGAGAATTIVGAGSTLVAPLVAAWSAAVARKSGVDVQYSAIGSGGGIAQMTARTVDFGASDAPLNPTQRAECGGCVQIPWALAATLVSYNVPGVSGRLRLTGPVLAQIYFGKITRWDDPAIARLNRGLALPAAKIAPVYRLDGSGDTYVFTDYLSRVSPAWRSKVGTGVSVTWPAGTGARGNAGVAAVVSTTLGAIGYLAIAQVRHSGLRYAVLRNRAGRYPDPMPATIAAAAATGRLGPSNGVSLVDAAGANAYPLSTFTYVIVRKGSSKLPALKKLIAYAVSPRGQELGRRLSFAPLPASVRAADLRALRRF